MTTQTFEEAHLTRAAAHALARPLLRSAQRWQGHVTDEHVAAVMFAIETGVTFYRNRAGRWLAPEGTVIHSKTLGRDLSTVIVEMIRTGLVRHVEQRSGMVTYHHLIPSLVHLRDEGHSACLFTGEDLGPMRARLVDDLALVDCLACEQVVARGHVRGL